MFTSNVLSNYAICYGMYFIMIWIIYLNKSNQLFDQKGLPPHNPGNLLALHIAGILWLGLVPLIWAHPILNLIIGERNTGATFTISLINAVLLMIFVGIHQGKQSMVVFHNIQLPTKSYYRRYFALRIPFLLAYELFFRGQLLFLNTDKMGLGMAIMVDMLVTFVLHVFSGKRMKWACIPFSLIACLLNTQAQAIWPSIMLHLAISLSFELTAIRKVLILLKTNPTIQRSSLQ